MKRLIPSFVFLAVTYILSGIPSFLLTMFVGLRLDNLLNLRQIFRGTFGNNAPYVVEVILLALLLPLPTILLTRGIYYFVRKHSSFIKPLTNAQHVLASFWIASLSFLVFFNIIFPRASFGIPNDPIVQFMLDLPMILISMVSSGIMFLLVNALIAFIDRGNRKDMPIVEEKVDTKDKFISGSVMLLSVMYIAVIYWQISSLARSRGNAVFNTFTVSLVVVAIVRFGYYLIRKVIGKTAVLSAGNHVVVGFLVSFLMMFVFSQIIFRYNFVPQIIDCGAITVGRPAPTCPSYSVDLGITVYTALFIAGWNLLLVIYKKVNDASPKIYLPGSRR